MATAGSLYRNKMWSQVQQVHIHSVFMFFFKYQVEVTKERLNKPIHETYKYICILKHKQGPTWGLVILVLFLLRMYEFIKANTCEAYCAFSIIFFCNSSCSSPESGGGALLVDWCLSSPLPLDFFVDFSYKKIICWCSLTLILWYLLGFVYRYL